MEGRKRAYSDSWLPLGLGQTITRNSFNTIIKQYIIKSSRHWSFSLYEGVFKLVTFFFWDNSIVGE